MLSNSTEARLRYLDTASNLLLVSSPALSAYLQAERNSTFDDGDNETPAPISHRSCNACGTILIPGWSCKGPRDARTSRNSRLKTSPKESRRQSKRFCCSTCGAVTTLEVDSQRQTKPKISDQLTATHAAQDSKANLDTIATSQSDTTNVKASSRRTRSKRSSLQSLLAVQKKADSEKPKRLRMDLTDLMQR